MPNQHLEITLSLTPRSRCDIIDVARILNNEYRDLLEEYRKLTCCSLHTTVGYIDQGLGSKLHSEKRLAQFIRIYRILFPPHAGCCSKDVSTINDIQEFLETGKGTPRG
jgi:hypothetical protein